MIPDCVKDYLDRFPDITGAELARSLRIPGRSARRYVRNYKEKYAFIPVAERREALQDYLGTSYVANPIKRSHRTRKVVAVGDFHGNPDPEIVRELIKVNADIYIFGGDLFDQIISSHWPAETKKQAQRRKKYQGRDELAELRSLIELILQETNGEIHILLGNHDIRVVKNLLSSMPDWILKYYKDPMELLCEGLEDRVQLVSNDIELRFPNGKVYPTDMSNEFVYVLGDVLFSHLNYTSSIAETGVSKLYRMWFQHWERPLNLQHINILVQFHVHQRTLLTMSGGHMLLIEPGMAGRPEVEDYKHGYHSKWKPSVHGFLSFTQVNQDGWITDPESIQLIAPYLTKEL